LCLRRGILELIDRDIEACTAFNKGSSFYREGNYDEAIKCLDEAIRLDPEHTGAWNVKGIALEALGRSSEADATFAKSRELGYIKSKVSGLHNISTKS